jgi:methylenetetrahydrofolate--tRNA-(uracil-5-)-methyltransferase
MAAEHYSMVGFQTRLRWPEQKRVFRMIPGLEEAAFVRYGQMHRNSYINAPAVLEPTLAASSRRDFFFAGQISGVEGYTESAATGLLAGINAARAAREEGPVVPPEETMLGALCRYLACSDPEKYQPRNATFGLLPPPEGRVRGRRARREARSNRALEAMRNWAGTLNLPSAR